MNANSAKPAAQTSSSNTFSAGEWLMPPRQRTNSIPTCSYFGPKRYTEEKSTIIKLRMKKRWTLVKWERAIASCPAPLIKNGSSFWISPVILWTAESAADLSCELNSESQITASASCWNEQTQSKLGYQHAAPKINIILQEFLAPCAQLCMKLNAYRIFGISDPIIHKSQPYVLCHLWYVNQPWK